MASLLLLVVFILSGFFPVLAQDTRTDQAGSVLREYVDKGYCTYTYVFPPGPRREGCTPPGLERQLAETREETARLKNQVDRLTSLVESLLSRVASLPVTEATPVTQNNAEEVVESAFTCNGKDSGPHPDPENCRKFYMCAPGHPAPHHFDCAPGGLVFDVRLQVCNWPWAVPPPCGTQGSG
ncbi:uncharacterized protein LOC144922618 [Branchiostoma floridae x Branchiostoma belcheri]